MIDLLEDRTILIVPTVPGIAPLVDTPIAELENFRARAMRLLCISSLTRLPQLNLPAASLLGCPLGVSLIGPAGADEALIQSAQGIIELTWTVIRELSISSEQRPTRASGYPAVARPARVPHPKWHGLTGGLAGFASMVDADHRFPALPLAEPGNDGED